MDLLQLAVLADAPLAAALQGVAERSGRWELCAVASSSGELRALAHAVLPDAYVLSPLEGTGHEFSELLSDLGIGSVPALVIDAPGHAISTPLRDQLAAIRVSVIKRSIVLRDDAAARKNVLFRLDSIAERLNTRRRQTLAGDELQDAIDQVMRSAQRADVGPAAAGLSAWPADMVLLLGDVNAREELAEVLQDVFRPPVPVVLCLAGLSAEETIAVMGPPLDERIAELPTRGSLRALQGLYACNQSGLTMVDERYSQGDDDAPGGVLGSASTLGSGLVAIQFSQRNLKILGHEIAQRSGCMMACLRAEDAIVTDAAIELARAGFVGSLVSRADLAWYLRNLVPRRG